MVTPADFSLHPTAGNVLKHDGPAGLAVFLIALPLCLGIALASGAPVFSGIIAGMVGGIVVSFLSGSQVSVSGPAAGLAVIVATGIQASGSYQAFLAAVVLGGALQLIFALLRAGVIGDYVPNSVIKGMPVAIGIIIILKQIPHALGRDADFEGDLSFFYKGQSNTLTDIAAAVLTVSPGALVITAVSLLALIYWKAIASRGPKFLQQIPAPLLVVALGIGLNQAFRAFLPSIHLSDPGHLVALPVAASLQSFFGQFSYPDFTELMNKNVLTAAFTIAVVGSLESLLSLEAADKLDPYKRISSPNRELFAQGIGNMLSGLIGGLPITSVVVRTSANVYSGARTWFSSFIHGALLLVLVPLIPGVLNQIPLCALAAILLVIGSKLTRLSIYKEQFSYGYAQFLPFIVTVIAIVFTDLLKGVLVGLAFGVFFVIRSNHHAAFIVVNQENWYLMRFNKDATFVNKSDLKSRLRRIPEGSTLVIDATRAIYIDNDIREVVSDFQALAGYKNITIEYRNFQPADHVFAHS